MFETIRAKLSREADEQRQAEAKNEPFPGGRWIPPSDKERREEEIAKLEYRETDLKGKIEDAVTQYINNVSRAAMFRVMATKSERRTTDFAARVQANEATCRNGEKIIEELQDQVADVQERLEKLLRKGSVK